MEVLQARRREAQTKTLSREMDVEFHPHDMEHEGEPYYATFIQNQNMLVENQVCRR